jgi:hypothetical protein
MVRLLPGLFSACFLLSTRPPSGKSGPASATHGPETSKYQARINRVDRIFWVVAKRLWSLWNRHRLSPGYCGGPFAAERKREICKLELEESRRCGAGRETGISEAQLALKLAPYSGPTILPWALDFSAHSDCERATGNTETMVGTPIFGVADKQSVTVQQSGFPIRRTKAGIFHKHCGIAYIVCTYVDDYGDGRREPATRMGNRQ